MTSGTCLDPDALAADWVAERRALGGSSAELGRVRRALRRGDAVLDGRPLVAVEAGPRDRPLALDPEVLGRLHEATVADAARRRAGVYYTPRAEIDLMARLAVGEALSGRLGIVARAPLLGATLAASPDERARADAALERLGLWPRVGAALEELRVLDPACGAGAFLVGLVGVLEDLLARADAAAGRRRSAEARRAAVAARLTGVDTSSSALRVARVRLELAAGPAARPRLVRGDGLAIPAGERFDLVIGNPPYVRHEEIAPPDGSRARPDAYKAWLRRTFDLPGRSDLYAYFVARGLGLLAPGGALCLLTSTSWLDAGYGAALRRALAERAHLRLVLEDEAARAFADADVNTGILLASAAPGDGRARFAAITRPVLQLDAAALVAIATAEAAGAVPGGRVRPVAEASLEPGEKWATRNLRAPDALVRVLDRAERAATPLVALGAHPGWTLGRGRRTGWDPFFVLEAADAARLGLEPRFLRPLARSPLEFAAVGPATSRLERPRLLFACHAAREALAGTAALRHIAAGERAGAARHRRGAPPGRWYDLGPGPTADVLLPVAAHDRFFVVLNDARLEAHQRFGTLVLDEGIRARAPALAALLCSTLAAAQLEALGRRALGQGALDVPPVEWRRVRIPDPTRLPSAHVEALARLWPRLAATPPPRLAEAGQDPARAALDRLVAEILGEAPSALEELRTATVERVAARLAKARGA